MGKIAVKLKAFAKRRSAAAGFNFGKRSTVQRKNRFPRNLFAFPGSDRPHADDPAGIDHQPQLRDPLQRCGHFLIIC